MTFSRPKVQIVTEALIDEVIVEAGGRRAYETPPEQGEKNADYLLDGALIELKLLEQEGLLEESRQKRLAELFRPHFPTRPVIVLDPDRLPVEDRRKYVKILETPVKTAVSKARGQLKQSRERIGGEGLNILMVVNNAYTALGNDDLADIVENRVRNDTKQIDAVIVGGGYFYSDGVDLSLSFPLELRMIAPDLDFSAFDALKRAWGNLGERFATATIMGIPGSASVKEAVADSCFDVDGITYVKPAPIMGIESQIYVRGRPRNNVKVAGEWPPVGLITPDIPKADFASFQAAFPDEPLLQNWESWQALWAPAKDEASPLQPVVAMKTSYRGWCGWRKKSGVGKTVQSLSAYAMYCFNAEMQKFRSAAVETEVVPPRAGHYVLSVTEVIGMDAANDVSSIGIAYNSPGKPLSFDEFVLDSRIGREQSLALACAYAVKTGARGVLWYEDKTYAWV